MRVLLAAEGPSDALVAGGIITRLRPDAQIDPKQFPARGFAVVQRLMADTVRASHFGFYDVLVVHFDLDDTLPAGAKDLTESPRCRDIQKAVGSVLPTLRDCNRPASLRTVLMTPLPSTDAWLCWGREGGAGTEWEGKDRHALKRKLYGHPPIDMVEKARAYTERLLTQMAGNAAWPVSLRVFWAALEEACAGPDEGE